MSKHEDRERMSLMEALSICDKGNMIDHVVDNGDSTFSVVSHIVCEYCDFCQASYNKHDPAAHLGPFAFKEDIYELVGRE